MNKKGQTGGLITTLVMGIAGLIIGVIVAFVIVSTLTDADLLESTAVTVVNESDAWMNVTPYTLDGASATYNPRDFAITAVWNLSTQVLLTSGHYTVNAVSGAFTNASTSNYSTDNYLVNISYTYVIDGSEEGAVNKLSGNFSSGIDKVSAKIPTVLLIAAIILILAILAVLVAVWQKMKLGQGGL